MKIAHITPKADFTLLIESDEGQFGLFGVRPYLELEAFRPLQGTRRKLRTPDLER